MDLEEFKKKFGHLMPLRRLFKALRIRVGALEQSVGGRSDCFGKSCSGVKARGIPNAICI